MRTYNVQVVTTGTQEPIYRWYTVVASMPSLAEREAVKNARVDLGRVDVVSVVENN